jgi:DNA polymerase elongation subunit (family B)
MEYINTSAIINMDFASLYPNTQKAYNIGSSMRKAVIRKMKIKKIFNER